MKAVGTHAYGDASLPGYEDAPDSKIALAKVLAAPCFREFAVQGLIATQIAVFRVNGPGTGDDDAAFMDRRHDDTPAHFRVNIFVLPCAATKHCAMSGKGGATELASPNITIGAQSSAADGLSASGHGRAGPDSLPQRCLRPASRTRPILCFGLHVAASVARH